MQIRKPGYMTQGKKDSLILSFIGQKEIQSCRLQIFYKTPMEAKSSCTFTPVVEGDKAECHAVQRQRKFYTENLQSNNRENREGSDLTKITKNCLYSSGITKMFSH